MLRTTHPSTIGRTHDREPGPDIGRILRSWSCLDSMSAESNVSSAISTELDDEINSLHAMRQAMIIAVKLSHAHRARESEFQLPFHETAHYSNPPKLRLTWRLYRSVNVSLIGSGSMSWKVDAVLETISPLFSSRWKL